MGRGRGRHALQGIQVASEPWPEPCENLVECRVGQAARWSTYSRSRPESVASQNGHDCFAMHKKMVGDCLSVCCQRIHPPTSLGFLSVAGRRNPPLSVQLQLGRDLSATHGNSVETRASPCFRISCRTSWWTGRMAANPTGSAASYNGRDYSATHKKLVGYHHSALLPKNISADQPRLS